MYKVFFNDRTVILCRRPDKLWPERNGIFHKFTGWEELLEIIRFFTHAEHVRHLSIFNSKVDKLQASFEAAFKIIYAAGGIVKNADGKYLFMIRNNLWDLPKGKAEGGETMEETAVREITEECGITNLKIKKKLPVSMHTYPFKGGMILKKTRWFLLDYAGQEELKPQEEEGITHLEWIDPQDFGKVKSNTYASLLDVLETAGL